MRALRSEIARWLRRLADMIEGARDTGSEWPPLPGPLSLLYTGPGWPSGHVHEDPTKYAETDGHRWDGVSVQWMPEDER